MFNYQIMNVNGSSRWVSVKENYHRWPWADMQVGDYFIINEDPIAFGQAKAAARGIKKHLMKFSCSTIRSRDGFFRHGIITRTD